MFKKLSLLFCLVVACFDLTSAKFLFGTTDLSFGRALLAKKWRKCTIEKRTKYVGTPIKVVRGVKSSHHCCVECKNKKGCDRWTFLPGKWDKCSLFSNKNRSMYKIKAKWHISGYATWRLKLKSWPKDKRESYNYKPTKEQSEVPFEDPNAGGGDAYEASDAGLGGGGAYEAPDAGFGGGDAYEAPGFDSGSGGGAYEDPWSGGGGGYVPDWGYDGGITNYKRMTGKTVYGRRLNSILPCVGNKASTSGRCEYLCTQTKGCNGWTWTDEFNCGWIGENQATGVCYLVGEADEDDVFDAPGKSRNFISGLMQ
eukprot:jgi/Picre1/27470/NNA_000437.t1